MTTLLVLYILLLPTCSQHTRYPPLTTYLPADAVWNWRDKSSQMSLPSDLMWPSGQSKTRCSLLGVLGLNHGWSSRKIQFQIFIPSQQIMQLMYKYYFPRHNHYFLYHCIRFSSYKCNLILVASLYTEASPMLGNSISYKSIKNV